MEKFAENKRCMQRSISVKTTELPNEAPADSVADKSAPFSFTADAQRRRLA